MKKKIAIDIGHSKDTFAKSNSKGIRVPEHFEEFWFNSAVGAMVIDELMNNYKDVFNVIVTQPIESTEVPLTRRIDLVNSEKADMFISIHADWNANTSANGYWVFYREGNLLGKKLAEIWNRHAKNLMSHTDRGIWKSIPNDWTNFYVLRTTTTIPSILIEHAFFSNNQDRELLKSKEFQKLCKDLIIKTICEYFGAVYKGSEDVVEKIKVKATILGNNTELEGFMFEGRNYIQIRELLEKLGFKVGWDNETKTVLVDFELK